MYNMNQNTIGASTKIQEDCSILMSPPQLADYLGIGRGLAYKLLADNVLCGFKIGNQWKVSKQAVDLYIAKKSNLI